MRNLIAAIFAIALAGCATATPYPAMRPLTAAHIQTMGPTPVVLSQNNDGVEKAWFFRSTSQAGAAYGIIGALVSATMDIIINAGPSHRAQKAADEMAELITTDALNESLAEHLRHQVPTDATPPTGVSFSGVQVQQRLMEKTSPDDTVLINVSYTLSEDASTLRILAVATYQNPATPYHTPYDFHGSVPRSELTGPAYSNTFTYYSAQLPVPTLTPELKDRLVASIQDASRDANGQLPQEGTNEFKSMNHEIENARDDNLTKDEISIFLTREWLRDHGARLHQEIEQAHEFIARYVALDMNRTAIPSYTGQDELLETMPDERTVRRIGAGPGAGSYVSSAANVTSFSTYGNAIGVAHVNQEHMAAVRNANRPAAQQAHPHHQ